MACQLPGTAATGNNGTNFGFSTRFVYQLEACMGRMAKMQSAAY